MLDANPGMFEATKLSLTILSEISGMKAESTSYILQQLRTPQRQPNWELMTFLLEELFTDTGSVIAILNEARTWSSQGNDQLHKTCSQFLMPSAAILSKCVIETDLCTTLVEQYDGDTTGATSVLQFVCETFTLPFKHIVSPIEEGLFRTVDYPRSKSERINLARTCLLAAICTVAPWIESPLVRDDSTSQETDLTALMVSLRILCCSKDLQSIDLLEE